MKILYSAQKLSHIRGTFLKSTFWTEWIYFVTEMSFLAKFFMVDQNLHTPKIFQSIWKFISWSDYTTKATNRMERWAIKDRLALEWEICKVTRNSFVTQ